MSTKPSPAPIIPLHLPGLPPSQRPDFDMRAATDAIHLAAGRLIAHLATLRSEIERMPLPDADPDRDETGVPRAAVLGYAIGAAEVAATSVRVALGVSGPSRCSLRRVRDEAEGAEALLILVGHELDRAPWRASEGRLELLGELVACAEAAARLVRQGLVEVAARLAGR